MSVSNGQLANATTFNNAFMSRTADDNTTGKKDLENADAVSGPNVENVQREINSLDSYTGRSAGSVFDVLPSWANTDIGTINDTLFDRTDALTAEFNPSTGHTHSGAGGEGPQIAANTLTGLNYYRADWQEFQVTGAAGFDDDVSASFSGFTPNGSTGSAGVITTAPNNKVYLVKTSDGTNIEDAGGQRVYGRLTESAGVWTLTYYTNEAGVETAYSMTSTNITVYFRQVFTLGTLPTIGADVGAIGSLDYTADIVDASATQRGAVSIGTQTFGGLKTFQAGALLQVYAAMGVATDAATTGTAAAATYSGQPVTRFTNASLVSIASMSAGSDGRLVIWTNLTGSTISFVDGSGIETGTGADLDVEDTASVWAYYDNTSSTWRITGGAGGANTVLSNLVAPTAINVGLPPGVDSSINLGTFNKRFNNAYFEFITDSNDDNVFDTEAKRLLSGGIERLDWSGSNVLFFSGIALEDPGASAFKITIQAPTLAADYSLILPVDDGAPGEVLSTDGSGNLSWTTVSSGGSYTTQNFTGTSFTATTDGFQRWRYTAGSAQTLTAITGTLLVDSEIILIVGTSDTNTITLNNNDVSGGWLLNGSWTGYRGSTLQLQWDDTMDRFVEVSRNG